MLGAGLKYFLKGGFNEFRKIGFKGVPNSDMASGLLVGKFNCFCDAEVRFAPLTADIKNNDSARSIAIDLIDCELAFMKEEPPKISAAPKLGEDFLRWEFFFCTSSSI